MLSTELHLTPYKNQYTQNKKSLAIKPSFGCGANNRLTLTDYDPSLYFPNDIQTLYLELKDSDSDASL
ncbi:hypothetical protein PFLA_b1094 [Pseudoalteromonas flavipulchra NCIMB 2033 = ATCC BAA-314]|nr:hypothetical protein [Pseudoalteromonas flavipulchra NCIMB 2033 = ATCC BAA-314]